MSATATGADRSLDDRIRELRTADEVELDDVTDFLIALPDPASIEHRIGVENLAAQVPASVEHLRAVLDQRGMVFEEANAKDVRFSAFLALHAHHRRKRDLTQLEQLHDEYDHLFSDRSTYGAARGELLRLRGSYEDVVRAIEAFEDAAGEAPENPWLHHAVAETIVEALEEDTLPGIDREDYRDRAKRAVDRAIERRPEDGKYRVTRGRLLALDGEYDRARAEIERGIHLTDPAREDYALRTARFQRHLLGVEIEEEEGRLWERFEAAQAELDDLRDRSAAIDDRAEDAANDFRNAALQFLGFFTAVLAAVVTTVQIAVSSPEAAGALILMVFGGLAAAVGVFAVVTGDEDPALTDPGALAAAGGFLTLFVGFVASALISILG